MVTSYSDRVCQNEIDQLITFYQARLYLMDSEFKILEKDIVDEIIFRTQNQWNRIMLELMARGCMRIGKVLNLTPMDIEDRKVIIQDPKSGTESEVVFFPQKVIDRMRNYVRNVKIKPDAKIFPITYAWARLVVKKSRRFSGYESQTS